jgi:hypothetical protein
VERASAICNTFCTDSSVVLVPRHRREVCPLARRVMLPRSGATRIHPITGWPALFPTPLPALPLVGLRASLPHVEGQYGLTTFRKVDPKGLGALSPPGALRVHDRILPRPCTRSSALLAQAWQHLRLVAHHDVYREFAYAHHTLQPAPSPPDAGRYTVPSRIRCQSMTVGTVSAGSVRVVTFPHICVGYC